MLQEGQVVGTAFSSNAGDVAVEMSVRDWVEIGIRVRGKSDSEIIIPVVIVISKKKESRGMQRLRQRKALNEGELIADCKVIGRFSERGSVAEGLIVSISVIVDLYFGRVKEQNEIVLSIKIDVLDGEVVDMVFENCFVGES